ncbi:hypothetical protein KC361_g478, partial [Hortaea werneckii]
MHPLFCILAFLCLTLAALTQNTNATSTSTVVGTDPTTTTTIAHASTLSRTSTSTPSSTPCPILIENEPWLLTNITHFVPSLLPFQNHSNSTTTTSSSSSPTRSSSSSSASAALGPISFHFRDTNRGLELETRCSRILPRHFGSSEVEPKSDGTYFPCEDGRVRFAFTAATAAGQGMEGMEDVLKVGRVHRDD